MHAKDYAELGPLLDRFETDLGRIWRGKLTVILISLLLAGIFFSAAIFAEMPDRNRNDPFNEALTRVACGAIAIGSIALGVYMFLRVSREANSEVAVHEQGMVVDWFGERFPVFWRDIRDVKIEGRGTGLIFSLLEGGKRSTLLLVLHDKSCTLLPGYLLRMPELAEIVSARTGIPIPKLHK